MSLAKNKISRQIIRNRQAVGSIPIIGSMKKLSLTVRCRIVRLFCMGETTGALRNLNREWKPRIKLILFLENKVGLIYQVSVNDPPCAFFYNNRA